MKDLHNHILFGIDDGSRDIEESIEIIEEAKRNGYTDLILTPHYRQKEDFTCDNREKYKRFHVLEEEIKRRNIKINIYLGNEITLDEDFFYFLKTNQLVSLNASRYLLLELPFKSKLEDLEDIISELRSLDLIPIIAHPERYEAYNIEDFQKMIHEGVLFQGNIGSLYNKYGTKSKNVLEEMLRRHMIHFIGSDTHHSGQTSYSRIYDVVDRIENLTGSKEMAVELVDSNISKVIKNEILTAYPVREKKQGLRILRVFNR